MKTTACLGFFLLAILSGGIVNPLLAADEQRQAYDKMVEEATREADEYVQQKQKEQREAAKQAEEKASSADDKRVQAERKRLKTEMNNVRARGLGPNFTEGMRENQLKELESKLDQLNSDPKAYFNQ
ncbi:hypothetical protein DSCW_59710 [Desulfosarcina widdelii]|uniref:Uncharacterized protein n=1 Tax=Desulfosarcina widdelii TaxID=947919 RepID=A0A5K7ZJW8_9BACT|nr:hypothetical protein [Desulfosarcina widdelii]BBO78554.1 hypothetical protein DSCW_59710 [Desulfosarcina widdelii]